MKTVFVLLAVCGVALGGIFFDDEYELERLRKFLLRDTAMYGVPLCPQPVDVVFVMDRSRSIWGPNFELEKQFVQNMAKTFEAEESRFGVITWAEGADVMIKLGQHKGNPQGLQKAIGAITQRPEIGGSTETWAALRLLREQVLTPAVIRNSDSVPLVILITDGASQKKTLTAAEAKKVHAMNVTVFAIGIKERDMDRNELKAIASSPSNVIMLDNWDEAANKLKEISSEVCPSQNIDGCSHNRPLDIVFSMSNQANDAESAHSFDLVEGVLASVSLGAGKVQVGLSPRPCLNTWEQIALNAHDTKEAFIGDMQTRELSFSSSLGDRFGYLSQTAFSAANGAQTGPDVMKVAVMIIDNVDDIQDMASKAKRLRGDGVRLIVIAVGDVTASDVSALSTDVIHVASYSRMTGAKTELLKMLCDAQKFNA